MYLLSSTLNQMVTSLLPLMLTVLLLTNLVVVKILLLIINFQTTGKEDEMRFEEGYDLYDPDYILWLELHHPEAIPKDRHTLTCAPTAEHSSGSSTPSNIPRVLSLGGSASSLSLSPIQVWSLLSRQRRLRPLVVRQVLSLSLQSKSGHSSVDSEDCAPWWFGKFSLSLQSKSGHSSVDSEDCATRWFGKTSSLSLSDPSLGTPQSITDDAPWSFGKLFVFE